MTKTQIERVFELKKETDELTNVIDSLKVAEFTRETPTVTLTAKIRKSIIISLENELKEIEKELEKV